MNDRFLAMPIWFGTPGADATAVIELQYPWTLVGIKAYESNAGAATLAAADSGATLIAATAVGQNNNPAYLQMTGAATHFVAANEALILTLDYDGAGSTAGQNIGCVVIGLIGEG